MPDRLDEVLASNDTYLVATGFQFTEGPLWRSDGSLLFVDIRTSTIHRVIPGRQPETFRDNSGGSNGLTFDLSGRLVMCEGDNRRITRMEPDGSITVLADNWDGKRLHRPNDIVCKSDGSLYFTNPNGRIPPEEREIDFSGVHRIASDGSVTAVLGDTQYPNGLAFSPDESRLYVANTRDAMQINVYDVNADGTVSNGRRFADMSSEEPDGVPDGMKVDAQGRVYCTGPGGCWVFDPDGSHLGIIRLPEIPANCAWGGHENSTMYFTARTSVYSISMKTRGSGIIVRG